MAFHFRHFDVEDEQSSMRVGTDTMLLGAWADPGKAANILDIGTGCGVLALMMAQKSQASIIAIDIDIPSVTQAQLNFNSSPWHDRLVAVQGSLRDFTRKAPRTYGFIISNPPYFSNSLRSPSERKNSARHDRSLPAEELLREVSGILAGDGSFALILPAGLAEGFIAAGISYGLYLRRRLQVRPKPATPPLRTLMEFSRMPFDDPDNDDTLIIQDEKGAYSQEYLALTHEFHNF
jgi:tRNA1Val (adenine37-N6)-methyltransferase